jgi:hypothetical protein
MNKQQMSNLVSLIAEMVRGDEGKVSGCSPVTLQIGFVNNIVQHDGIIIKDAPPAVTEAVMEWVSKNGSGDEGLPVAASAGFGGLFVR